MKEFLVLIPLEDQEKKRLESYSQDYKIVFKSPSDVTKEEVENASILWGNPDPSLLKDAKKLEWMQTQSAGYEQYTAPGVLRDEVILTNARGAYGQAIAEHMLASLSFLMKKLNLYVKNQEKHLWKSEGKVRSFTSQHVLVVGYGNLGSSFAKLMKGLGSTVSCYARRPIEDGIVSRTYLPSEKEEALKNKDVIALFLPSNEETKHFLSTKEFNLMSPKTIVLNAGRGDAIDTDALMTALKEKKIHSAAIDVIEEEPLKEDHPIWELENILITPHIAGWFHIHETYERLMEIAFKNLESFQNKKEMTNVISRVL
ncbi:D-2-hydroxyacid dehydrogenase [Guggenheimella bovis]